MKKYIVMIGLSVLSVFLVASISFAGGLGLKDLDPTNKNSGIRQFGRDIDPTNTKGRMGDALHAEFKICNKTGKTIYFSLNRRKNFLRNDYCAGWTTKGQASISFDSEWRNGFQGKSYTLNDGTYYFQNATWRYSNGATAKGLDLKRK